MNKRNRPVVHEVRVRTTQEQYEWLRVRAEMQYEGNMAQLIRKLIEEKIKVGKEHAS